MKKYLLIATVLLAGCSQDIIVPNGTKFIIKPQILQSRSKLDTFIIDRSFYRHGNSGLLYASHIVGKVNDTHDIPANSIVPVKK